MTKRKQTSNTASKDIERAIANDATTTKVEGQENTQGVASTAPAVTDPAAETPPPRVTVKKRLEREGRWGRIEPIRDRMMKEARGRGMSKLEAQEWVYPELDRLYPTIEGVSDTMIQGGTHTTIRGGNDDTVAGLSDIPAHWGVLADNANQAVELSWCQAQRLRVVHTRPDGTVYVELAKATIAAPSWGTLSWLETSIRSYAKYVDTCARVLSGQADEQDIVRRERMRIEDIRALLDEMHRDES